MFSVLCCILDFWSGHLHFIANDDISNSEEPCDQKVIPTMKKVWIQRVWSMWNNSKLHEYGTGGMFHTYLLHCFISEFKALSSILTAKLSQTQTTQYLNKANIKYADSRDVCLS